MEDLKMFTRKGTLASLSLACASAWSFGAAAEASSFELGSYLSYPGGKEIAARDYAGAIKSASGMASYAGVTEPLVAATNLCVALTATGAFPDARAACDRALELARREDAIASPRFRTETATSRALSNRGVLRALNGDSVGAANDFRAAAKMRSPWAAAVRNLAFLESSPARVASAEGGAD
jgi:Flp pilus assembly protein TadD